MFEKKADYKLIDIQPLNLPVLAEYMVNQHIKVAQKLADVQNEINTSNKLADMSRNGDNTVFDLEAEINKHPNSLFVKCFAIKADEENDNGDFFGKEELKKATPTFVGVPVFTNHKNDDINEARGKIIHSWWDEDRNGIMVIARVDAEAYPQLARGIREEYIVGTSMGCQVHHSICSICHNYAETPDQYCTHIKEHKTRILSQKKVKCNYHKNGPKDSVCPLCGSTRDDLKTFDVIEKKAYELNYGIKFIENSFVVNPACHDCGVTEVIDPIKFRRKVAEIAEILPKLLKSAGKENILCDNKKCYKIAGQKQLQDLHQALDLLVSVSRDMLQQKDQIDLEFLSDLVKVLADLQTVTDELTQQGYGRLPEPGKEGYGSLPEPEQAAETPVPQEVAQPAPSTPVNPTPGGGSKIYSGPTGLAGTVTGPIATKEITLEKLSNILSPKQYININTAIFPDNIELELKDTLSPKHARL